MTQERRDKTYDSHNFLLSIFMTYTRDNDWGKSKIIKAE